MEDKNRIIIFDTTMRDGEQSPGASMSLEEKIQISRVFDELGVDIIEAGFPIASNGDFDESIELMIEMSENYKVLIDLFPENTKEGFKTEALPIIWENKDEFNSLMKKSSTDMIELAKVIESSDDIRASLQKFMWNNCKACHSKFRAPH